jgi:competence protein ComFC
MPGYLAYKVYQWFWESLDWLYPPTCVGCGQKGTRWCTTCADQSTGLTQNICERCGEPQYRRISTLCNDCLSNPTRYQALRSWGIFQGSHRKAIHQLKYRRDVSLGEILVRPVIPWLFNFKWKIDLVIPVPLSLARLSERGYNQSSLLARPLALGMGIPYRPAVLKKTKETPSQVGLRRELRKKNVVEAFQANRELIEGKNILLVDDVATTGATMDECAAALLKSGASEVYGFTLARSSE